MDSPVDPLVYFEVRVPSLSLGGIVSSVNESERPPLGPPDVWLTVVADRRVRRRKGLGGDWSCPVTLSHGLNLCLFSFPGWVWIQREKVRVYTRVDLLGGLVSEEPPDVVPTG